jgi:PAS domain S-box-containing protein
LRPILGAIVVRGRHHPNRTVRRLVAALEPPARGLLPRGTVVVLAGLGLGAALLLTAELHLDGAAGLAVRAAVVALLALCFGLAAYRLHARIAVMEAIRHAQDAMGEGVVLLDPDTLEVVHASPAACAIFGRSELVGIDIRDTVWPSDRPMIDERRRLRSAGHRVPLNAELPIMLPDGRRRFVEWATTPLTVDGRPLLLSIMRDATAREQAKRRLAEEHAFMEAVLDAAAGPIVVSGPDGRMLRVNAAAARFAGRDPADLVGRTPWELGLLSADQAAEVAAALREGCDPYRHFVASRDRLVSWSATAMRDEAGQIRSAVSVGVDVTEQRAAEERARRALAALDVRSSELERSNRDLAQFVELASHDLREAVQAVTGFTDLLDAQAGSQLDARAASYLGAAREAAGTMAELLDGLAAYSRLGRGEALASDVDCEQTLDTVLRELAEEIAASGTAVTRDPLPVVPGDPDELATLLSQLLTNALRFGGAQVHVGAERRPLGWKLTVRDNGEGVPEGERQRIFQIFRRLHPRGAHRGAGVGLALCERIVERHGGAIWVDEAPGGGSAFHVTLPDWEAR